MTATSVYHNNETGIFLFSRQDGENNGFLAGVSPPGGGDPVYERGGDARRLAYCCNFGFWSRLGCSGPNAIIFSRKGIF